MTDRAEPARAFVWDHLRRLLEARGKGESAAFLRHFLVVTPASEEEVGRYRVCRMDMGRLAGELSQRFDAATGAWLGFYCDALARDSARMLPDEPLLAAATELAEPPPEAELVTATYEHAGDGEVFVARWHHRSGDGIWVEGDFIHVLVNGRTGRPFALQRRWHTLDTAFHPPPSGPRKAPEGA